MTTSSSVPPPERPRPIAVGTGPDEDFSPPVGWLDQAPVTRAIMALNVAVFAVQVVLGGRPALTHLPVSEGLALGASDALATIGENRWETLVTACFLHDGLLHIGLNMFALWQAGPLVERAVGSARFASMYLLAGALGTAASVGVAWLAREVSVEFGASGAVCGVVAAAMVLGWRTQGWRSPMAGAMVRWLGIVVAFGVFANMAGEGVSNSAHIGGAFAGALIAASWRRGRPPSGARTAATLAVCTGVLAACIGVVGWRDRTDRFATMDLSDRSDFTKKALDDGRCMDARDGERAVDRLRAKLGPATSLRARLAAECGLDAPPALGGGTRM